ncbi:hypothetical protein [Sporofaciens sp. SGI.106]|uniref:hypothetical protein n=1 Tax=Sporofaciens sp. SGI.106 TaxID=3420568 RepID=UPI003D06E375
MSIIGGSDGPTAVFIAGKMGMDWLNVFGLILVILLRIPNIAYAVRVKDQKNLCTNKFMNILEQIGRYACMFLMVFNIGIDEFGFGSVGAFLIYIIGNVLLMLSYWVIWILYFYKQSFGKQITLAILPTCLFLLSGITMRHYLLILFGLVFGVGHVYVTYKNRIE